MKFPDNIVIVLLCVDNQSVVWFFEVTIEDNDFCSHSSVALDFVDAELILELEQEGSGVSESSFESEGKGVDVLSEVWNDCWCQ